MTASQMIHKFVFFPLDCAINETIISIRKNIIFSVLHQEQEQQHQYAPFNVFLKERKKMTQVIFKSDIGKNLIS
jgi:hypothetical protein